MTSRCLMPISKPEPVLPTPHCEMSARPVDSIWFPGAPQYWDESEFNKSSKGISINVLEVKLSVSAKWLYPTSRPVSVEAVGAGRWRDQASLKTGKVWVK
eukprot:6484279-Amphidinium_carterae.1